MSDREIIIQLLRNVEWRLRANRLLNELALGLSMVLVFLIALKVWDLFSPLKAVTIAGIIGASICTYAGFVLWCVRRKGTLDQAAASVDRKAGLRDEIKTAFWFINNPRSSEWIEKQLQRAARNARNIDLERTYPSIIPRTSYPAAVMVLLFIGLNFVPLPLNHNWLMLQAAPAVSLTESERAALDSARQSLQRPAVFDESELNDSEKLDSIKRGLEEIARDLMASEELKGLAEAIMENQIDLAAQEMRKLAGQMGTDTPAAAQQMLQSFEKASNNSRPGLEQLTKNMGDLAQALENKDDAAIQEAVEKVAEELDRIDGEMQVHETGGEQIARGMEAPPGKDNSQVRQDGESPQSRSDSMGLGASNGTNGGEREAPPTLAAKLRMDVKLQQAGVKGAPNDAVPSAEELEEASRRERSTLDFRNVKSELSTAQKDVLNKERIPWEYRPLIKGYFQAIRPPVKK